MSIIKYQSIPAYTPQGDPSVVYARGDGYYKTAGYDNFGQDVRDALAGVTPKEGYAYLLIAAMGDQNWGPNRNGDFWPTKALSNPGADYGYKTYEANGRWYHHHQNKDPNASFGRVLKSFWNDRMGRIELLVEVDLTKDAKTRDALQSGAIIQTSMGAKIKWDCCIICHPNWEIFYDIPEEDMIIISKENDLSRIHEIGRKHGVDLSYITKLNPDGGPVGIHSNISKYCDHMKTMRGQIHQTGIYVCVANHRPGFFDISFVGVNADKSSFVLAKVASDATEYPNEDVPDDQPVKVSAVKAADQVESPGDNKIDKEVEGGQVISDSYDDIAKYYHENICPEMYKREPEMPDKVVDDMASSYSLPEIMSSFLAMGMFPHPREFQRIVMIQMGKRDELDKCDAAGDFLRHSDIPRYSLEKEPDEYPIGIGPDKINDSLLETLKHFFWERSGYRQPYVKRMVIIKSAAGMNAYINPASEAPQQRSIVPGLLASLGLLYAITAMESKKKVGDVVNEISHPARHSRLLGKVGVAVAGAVLANKIIGGMQKERYDEYLFDQQRKYAALGYASKKTVEAAAKSGDISGWALAKWLGPVVGSYAYGGHIINKARSGQRVTKAEEMVAKYPLGAGVGAALIMNRPGWIWNTAKNVGGVFKKAEMGFDMSQINVDDLPLEERDLGGIAVWEYLNKE